MIGHTIAHYEILEKLGEGGMGVVYKARDQHLDRFVAIKLLDPERVADGNRKLRFIREAKAASALSHPNIVHVYDIGEAGGVDFIAMEYVPGKTLDRLIPRHGMPLSEALKYAVQIADALAKAHSTGIVHRDLKPANVMVSDHGFAKVLDFGLAKLTETAPASEEDVTRTLRHAVTEEGTIVGTVAYMSPEQVEGKAVDARSDIFSFGSLLYEMLTGSRAFQADSKAGTMAAILREELKPASQVVASIPPEVDRVLKRCLKKEPVQRFQHMADLKVALEELRQESDSGVSSKPSTLAPKRRRLIARAGAVAGVAALLVAGIWFLRPASPPPVSDLVPVPLTTYPGFQGEPSFSPDGSQVAFVWDGGSAEKSDIYVKVVGVPGKALALTADPSPKHSPAWSPDGRFIAFVRRTGETSTVVLVPALSGPEREVVELPDVMNLAWSPDNHFLVISARDSPSVPFALFRLTLDTGEMRKLTFPPPRFWADHSPAFAPDGRTLAFSRSASSEVGNIFQLSLSAAGEPSGEPRQITFEERATNPAWTPDGRGIVFSAGPIRTAGLLRISTERTRGGPAKPQRLLTLGFQTLEPAISRSAHRLAYNHFFYHASIWRTALSGKTPIAPEQPLISSTRSDVQPSFSTDGSRIVFVSDRSGSPEIWACQNDGTNSVQLTSFGGAEVSTPRWSRDDTRILFDSTASGKPDIWVIPTGGGRPRQLTTGLGNNSNPSWSRDGQSIYFDSSRSGMQQVWKMPATGGEPVQLTQGGGWAPVESFDGKFLYYFNGSGDFNSLMRMAVQGGPPAKVLDRVSAWNVAVGREAIYFVSPLRPDRASLAALRLADNRITPLLSLKSPAVIHLGGLAVSPDGRSLLYTQTEQAGSELMLVENFR